MKIYSVRKMMNTLYETARNRGSVSFIGQFSALDAHMIGIEEKMPKHALFDGKNEQEFIDEALRQSDEQHKKGKHLGVDDEMIKRIGVSTMCVDESEYVPCTKFEYIKASARTAARMGVYSALRFFESQGQEAVDARLSEMYDSSKVVYDETVENYDEMVANEYLPGVFSHHLAELGMELISHMKGDVRAQKEFMESDSEYGVWYNEFANDSVPTKKQFLA